MNKSTVLAVSVAAMVSSALVAQDKFPRTGSTAGGGLSTSRLGGLRSSSTTPGGALAATPSAAASEARASGAVGEAADEQASDIYIPAGTELDIALKIYSQLVGKTVLRDPSVPDAKITIVSLPGQKLSKAHQIEAMEAMFEMNGIHLEPYGSGEGDERMFMRAVARDKFRPDGAPVPIDEDAEVPMTMKLYSVMIPFKNIPVDEAKTVLEGLKSSKGQLNVYERIGKILVTDTGLNINSMRKVAAAVDIATPVNENVFIRQIKQANVNDIKTVIEQIVQESQKELEKTSKAQQTNNFQQNRFNPVMMNGANGTLLRRPGQPNNNGQPAQPSNIESLISSVSDADRGMIRGKVLITADERSNKLMVITSEANMKFFDKIIEALDVTTTPEVDVKVIRLKYADAEDVADMINDLIGNSSSAKSSQRGNQNQNARNGTNGNMTRNTAQPNNNRTTTTNARSGESKAGELSKDNVTVLADKRINGLVIMAHKDVWPTVRDIVEKMDIKLSQVLIETCIIEVALDSGITTGIDWISGLRGNGNQALSGGGGSNGSLLRNSYGASGSSKIPSRMPGAKPNEEISLSMPSDATVSDIAKDAISLVPVGGGANYFAHIKDLDLTAVIQAAKTDSKSKYLASPVVMTVDNKEATINATKMRYLLKGFQSSGNSYSTIAVPDYEQKEVGIEIKVTPKINPNGNVMLEVEEKYSQISGTQNIKYATGNSSSGGSSALQDVTVPLTVTREMSADVMLENGATVVFGGLTETYQSKAETGIPFLKDIPYVGRYLFGSTEDVETKSELLVFMTPYVLDDEEAAQAKARHLKSSLSDARPWEDGGWSESALADPVPQKDLLRRLEDEAEQADADRANRLAMEKFKLERSKQLEKMSAEERKFWLEQHRDELTGREEKKAFDKQVEGYSQEDLKKLAESIRAKQVKKAEGAILEAEAAEQQNKEAK